MWDSMVHVSSCVKIVGKLDTCHIPWSVPRGTLEKLASMLDSLVRVSQQQRWKNHKNTFFVCHCLGAWEPGTGGQDVETRAWAGRMGQPKRGTTERETLRCDAGGNCWRRQRGPAPYQAQCDAPLPSIRGAEAGAGSMSFSSGSGGAGASGMGASSSSSDASAMAHSTGSSGASSGSICLATRSPLACSLLAFPTASRKSSSLHAHEPPSCPSLVLVAEVRDCPRHADSAPCFVHDHVIEGAVEDRASQRPGRLRLGARAAHGVLT